MEADQLLAVGGKTSAEVLKHVPVDMSIAKDDLIKTCQKNNLGKNRAMKLIEELVEDETLFEHLIPRPGKKPKVYLSRTAPAMSAGGSASD
ncbi:MAG: hypothetical protein WDM76_04835 [Limisphaerales bacterium]